MSALDRKLFRDLAGMKMQAIAIALVLACGVAIFIMSLTTQTSLQQTLDRYYSDSRFADVFAHLKRAPDALADRIEQIPGVGALETRIVVDVNLDVPTLPEPAVGRIISLPERGSLLLNDLYLRRGRWVDHDRPGEVLVSEAFAEAHDIVPGDTVTAIINQRLRELTIVGIVLSPEFIYEIRDGEFLPDPIRYGVFWMSRRQLAPAFDLDGAFNSILISLMPGALEAEVIDRLDDLTERYGGIGAYGREDQTSHRWVSGELEQLRAMMLIAPSIFLSVAAFLFNMVISRMIKTQREQIAALKAFGFTPWEIASHYSKFVGLIVLAGVILGIAVGAYLGKNLVSLYVEFFRFPRLEFVIDLRAIGPAVAISTVAAFAGAFNSLRGAMRLPPAEAMRPEPPPDFRPTIAERLLFQHWLPQTTRIVLRNIERQPVKAILTVLGMALAVSVLIIGNFNRDIIDHMIQLQFYQIQRQDMTIMFVEPTSQRALREVLHMPGVIHGEPFRAVPVRLRSAHHTERLALMGLPQHRDLTRLLNRDLQEVPLPDEGVLMSAKLAEILNIEIGDFVQVEVMEGRRPIVQVQLTGVIDDFTGLSAYMNITAVHQLMREQDAISGVHMTIDHDRADELYTTLKQTPRVASVTLKLAAIRSFLEYIAQSLLTMRTFTIVFATIIAFGVVYNSARISLAERGWELATLRIIGFTRGEISMILLGELAFLTLVSIPIGLAFGYGLCRFMVHALETEQQRLPFIIGPQTYGFAISVTLTAALISGLIVRRRLDRLDLIGVLKTRA